MNKNERNMACRFHSGQKRHTPEKISCNITVTIAIFRHRLGPIRWLLPADFLD
jgi:hypothetical protein